MTSNQQNPSPTYTNPGTYLITINYYGTAVGLNELVGRIEKNGTNITSAGSAVATTNNECINTVTSITQMNGTSDYAEGFVRPFGANTTIGNGISLNNLSCARIGP